MTDWSFKAEHVAAAIQRIGETEDGKTLSKSLLNTVQGIPSPSIESCALRHYEGRRSLASSLVKLLVGEQEPTEQDARDHTERSVPRARSSKPARRYQAE